MAMSMVKMIIKHDQTCDFLGSLTSNLGLETDLPEGSCWKWPLFVFVLDFDFREAFIVEILGHVTYMIYPEHSFDQLFLVVLEYDLKWPSFQNLV